MSQDLNSISSGIPNARVAAQHKPRSDKAMEHFAAKVLARLDAIDKRQAQAARAINVDASQFSKWLKEEATNRPTPEQLLLLARFLGVPMEFLVDDSMTEPPVAPEELPRDQQAVLDLYIALEITQREALRRLAGPGASEVGSGEADQAMSG